MSWDTRLMALMVVVWLVMATIWNSFVPMPEGARAWGIGAFVMLIVFAATVYAERRAGSYKG